jgi:hypothetical protein
MADQASGNGSPNQPTGTGAPAALDEERVAQIASQVMNNVFKARGQKIKDDIAADLQKGFGEMKKLFDDFAASNTSSSKGGKKAGKDAAGDPDEGSPEFQGMKRQMAEMRAQIEERDRKLQAAEDAQKRASLRSKLGEELGKVGIVDPARVKAASALLITEEGRVRLDEDGNAVFAESADSVLDLATGIKAWAKSEDAKIFIPATGARGSGDAARASKAQQASGPQEMSLADLGLGLAQAFGGTPIGG